MAGLKQLRLRIRSIKSTQKITKAMQLVSATKFTKAKRLISDSENYIKVLRNIVANIGSSEDLSEEERRLFVSDVDAPHLLVLITSERGLCGAYNFLVIKQVQSYIANLEKMGKQVKLIIIGKKGYDVLKHNYSSYIDSYIAFPKSHSNNLSVQIKDKILTMIRNSEIGSCKIFFNKYKNSMTQIPTITQIVPVEKQDKPEQEKYLSYEYERKGLISTIVDLYVGAQINYALLQSRASEEGARMTAMDNATKNAKELINKFTLKLNRSRQEFITKDLIEIIAGAEAL